MIRKTTLQDLLSFSSVHWELYAVHDQSKLLAGLVKAKKVNYYNEALIASIVWC